jgi:hypothetical protein
MKIIVILLIMCGTITQLVSLMLRSVDVFSCLGHCHDMTYRLKGSFKR